MIIRLYIFKYVYIYVHIYIYIFMQIQSYYMHFHTYSCLFSLNKKVLLIVCEGCGPRLSTTLVFVDRATK